MIKFDVTETQAASAYFDRWGYVVFKDAIDPQLRAAFWDQVEAAIAGNADLTYSLYGKLYQGPEVPLEGRRLPRIVDIESHVSAARKLILSPVIGAFLRQQYKGAAPTCLQSLTYKYSSEQGAHSDKWLVAPPHAPAYDRETLIAAWFALESSDERNGALVIYPGSHRIPKPDLQKELASDYGAYMQALDTLGRENGCAPEAFHAAAGDILFWHGDLIHAGGQITAESAELPTRKSLVTHYASIPPRMPTGDDSYVRVRHAAGSYFHKRRFLPPLRRSLFDRFIGGPLAS